MTVALTEFVLSNAVLKNGTFTATVQYGISTNQILSSVKIAVNWYDGITIQGTNYGVSANTGTFSISYQTTGAFLQVQAQTISIAPDGTINPQGPIIQGGTYYPTVINTAPSPPSLSSGTYNPPQPDGSNFYLTTTTSVGTATISITVKKPGDTSFGFFLDHIPLSPNGIIPIQLPFSTNPTLYGTYQFQAQAFDSAGNGSQLSNIATITINAPYIPSTINETMTAKVSANMVTVNSSYTSSSNNVGQIANYSIDVAENPTLYHTTGTFTIQTSGSFNGSLTLPSGTWTVRSLIFIGSTLIGYSQQSVTISNVSVPPNTGQNIGPLNIVSNTSTQNNIILSLSDYGYLVTNTALFNVSPQPVATTSSSPTITYTQLATNLGILSKTYTGQTPQTITINTSNSGSITVTVNGYTGNIGTVTTYSNISVTLKQTSTSSINRTFIIDTANYSQLLISNTLMNLVTNTLQNVNQPTNATIFDIQNFVNSQGNPATTQPPVVSTPIILGNTVTINYSSTGTAILITRNGTPISSTATLTTGTLVDQGLNPGTYQYTFVASNVGVQSIPITVSATISNPPPAQTNYAYNIQIPNVSNALKLITATNYGVTSSVSFPARAFVKTILNQDVATIPNTLNALFITNVGDTPNEVQVANALIGYFPSTPPPSTGPKRSLIEIAGGIFAGLLTLSLITGGSLKKGKR